MTLPGCDPFVERVLIVGVAAAEQIVELIAARPGDHRVIVGVVDDGAEPGRRPSGCPLLGPTSRLAEIVTDVRPHRVLVGLAERRRRTPVRALVESCVTRGIVVEDATDFCERLSGKLAIESLSPMSLVFAKRFGPSRVQQAFARVFSLIAAVAALLLLSPLLALIALAIKLDSQGPVLFVHDRIGMHGRPFKLLKFRTMSATTPRRSEWEADNRDRVTRVGKWLRAFRLDELPQFVNVIRGEMNLVGPRPHPVSNLELFTLVARNMNDWTGSVVSYYALRTMVRPGITGWAQVRYRYANDLEEEIEKLRYDLYYLKHMSAALDMRILFETVKVMSLGATGRGASAVRPRPAVRPIALPANVNGTHAA